MPQQQQQACATIFAQTGAPVLLQNTMGVAPLRPLALQPSTVLERHRRSPIFPTFGLPTAQHLLLVSIMLVAATCMVSGYCNVRAWRLRCVSRYLCMHCPSFTS